MYVFNLCYVSKDSLKQKVLSHIVSNIYVCTRFGRIELF